MGAGAAAMSSLVTGKAIADDMADDIDPADYMPDNQTVVHAGLVWKLNTGANPEKLGGWLRRKMWLSDAGGLYYFSRQHNMPLGRSVLGLRVRELEGKGFKGYFAFEMYPSSKANFLMGGLTPMILATQTDDERKDWMVHLRKFEDDGDELDPLESFKGHGLQQERCRLATDDFTSLRAQARHSIQSFESCLNATSNASRLSSGGPNMFCQTFSAQTLGTAGPIIARRRSMDALVLKRHSWHENDPTSEAKPMPKPRRTIGMPPMVRSNSQDTFYEKKSTIIFMDWDDTLFPTTWVREDVGLNWRLPVSKQLEHDVTSNTIKGLLFKFSEKAGDFIKMACDLMHVVIITLALDPWVSLSATNFTPGAKELLGKCGVKVVYARDHMTEGMRKEYASDDFKSASYEADFWMRVKAAAM